MKASSHVPPMTFIPVDTSFSDASPIQGRVGCCGLVAKRELGYRTPNTGTRMWRCGPVASVRGNNRLWTPVNMMSLRTPEWSSSPSSSVCRVFSWAGVDRVGPSGRSWPRGCGHWSLERPVRRFLWVDLVTVHEIHIGQVGMGAHRAGYRPPSPPIHCIASGLRSERLTRLFLVATRYFVLLGGSTKLTLVLT